MTKATVSIAAILALLTGFVLGQIGSLAMHAGTPAFSESNPSPQALATARSFYDGLNHLLASGDRSIETTVAPGFVDHTQGAPGTRTLPEMIDLLLALRATWPDLQIEQVDLEQRDHLIAARLQVDPGAPAVIPGVPLVMPAPSQMLEFLRVEGAGVTDRWDAVAQLPTATLSMTTDVDWNGPALAMPAIEHLLLEPGQSMQLPLGGPVILRVEGGSVRLDRAGIDLDGIRRPPFEPLQAGQVRMLGGDGYVGLQNISSEQANLWLFNVNASYETQEATAVANAETARLQTVAFIPLQLSDYLRGSPQRISITQVTLPPGTIVPVHALGLIEEIAVLDGEIDVMVDQGRALKCINGNQANPFDDSETIAAGEGVSAKGSASLGYRVVGPQSATLLIMRMESPPVSGGPSEPLP